MFLRILTYFWLLMTLVLLLKPGIGRETNVFFPGEDKVVHLGLFCSLTMLWYHHFLQEIKMTRIVATWVIIISGILLSGTTEIAQAYIPGRGSDIEDFISNILGVTIGIIAYLIGIRLLQFDTKSKPLRS
ncbi:MAG: VanZ family protein [Cyclobacteriaceae bacterium]